MRQRRINEGNVTVFDAAKDVLKPKRGKVLVEMRNGPASYESEGGVRFWKKHPFQWVSKEEAEHLCQLKQPEFRISSIEKAEDYYAY